MSQDLKTYFSNPLWYLNPLAEIKEFFINPPDQKNRTDDWYNRRNTFLAEVGALLDQNLIQLGTLGPNMDESRKEIDTIVIHHTGDSSAKAKNPISFINAMHLFTLYMPAFKNSANEYYKTPIWTNHFYKDMMTFIGYHYLVFKDGRIEQILKDEYIGWHCGNWDYNCRSIAIAFVDDLEEIEPTEMAIEAANQIIDKYEGINEILGHQEIKPSTDCPGNLFLGDKGWKHKLRFKE